MGAGPGASESKQEPQADSAGPGPAERAQVVPRTSSAEFRPVLAAYEYPLIVWESANTSIVLANKRAADLVGLPLEELVGRQIYDFFLPRDAVERGVLGIQSGTLMRIQARRVVVRQGQEQVPVWVWVRAIEIDDRRGGVAMVVPSAEVGSLSRDPDAPWRDLCPIAVGMAAADWRIMGISADVSAVLGLAADACIGLSLLDLIHPDDVALVAESGGAPEQAAMSVRSLRFRSGDDGWVEVGLLLAQVANGQHGFAFALIGAPRAVTSTASDRVAELEGRLRRIGSEVRAAGVLDEVDGLPAVSEHPQLGDLTTRQWEILSLLLHGERVSTIADTLFVSQSTVRNHLATIFRKFGVHSQAELLQLLRPRAGTRQE